MDEKKHTFNEWLFTFLLEHKDIEVRLERYSLYDEPGIALTMVDYEDVRAARKIREFIYPQYNPTNISLDDLMILVVTRMYERLKSNEQST